MNCKAYATEILDKVKALPDKKALAVITVDNDPASESYVRGKKRDCEYCGIPWIHKVIDGSESPEFVSDVIQCLNQDPNVGGIILQLPTPYDSDTEDILVRSITPSKDVDGFIPGSPFKPCTPEGIIHILKKEYDDLDGRDVLLVGRGKLVGKPLIDLLLAENCTVTVAHSHTKNLSSLIAQERDIIITAIDKVHAIDVSYTGAYKIIDAGIGYYDGKLCGNCYTDGLPGFYIITPVPGGVGLLTRAMLMAHVAKASDPTFTY